MTLLTEAELEATSEHEELLRLRNERAQLAVYLTQMAQVLNAETPLEVQMRLSIPYVKMRNILLGKQPQVAMAGKLRGKL